MIHTTFRALRKGGACRPRYRHLAKALGGIRKYGRDTPITAVQILDNNGLADLVWAWDLLRPKEEADRIGRLFACECAELSRHMVRDKRSSNAIDVARRFALGNATMAELNAARGAAELALLDLPHPRQSEYLAARTAEETVYEAVECAYLTNRPATITINIKTKIMRDLLIGGTHG